MSTLTFYHQVRVDGGKRTGIDIDGTQWLQSFTAGQEDNDPTLLWYVDIECKGRRVPNDPPKARDWLSNHSDFFVGLLTKIADDELEAGFDVDWRPFQHKIASGPDGTTVRITISAIRRLVARQIAKEIRKLAQKWTSLLKRLELLSLA